jgi:hypothetical protein
MSRVESRQDAQPKVAGKSRINSLLCITSNSGALSGSQIVKKNIFNMSSLRLGQEKLVVVCGVVVEDGRIDGDGKSAEVIAI